MNFAYETQGAITYLVCELEAAEQLDTLTLGMLTNNHIAGFAPVLYTEMNGQRYLKYNISAKVNAEQFFSGTLNKQRALTAFRNILNAICSADEYMIEQNCFLIAPEYIYLNVSSCETAMLCVPVVSDKDINGEVNAFFKKVLFSTQFDISEDAAYLTQLITYINSGASFSVYGLKDLVENLQNNTAAGVQVSSSAPIVQPPMSAPVQQPSTPQVPVSSFDSTISIDDMPAMMAQKQAKSVQSPVVENVEIKMPPTPSVQASVSPVYPTQPVKSPVVSTPPVQHSIPPVQPVQPPIGVPPAGKPMENGWAVSNKKGSQGGAMAQQPSVMQKPPVQNAPAFAIPGQPMGNGAKPQTPPAPKKQPKEEQNGDKKMTFFGLLSHYNKENAEIYKKQKEEAKAKKAANAVKPAQKPMQPPMNGAPRGMPMQQPPVQGAPMGNPMQPQGTPAQYRPPVQPMPIQNSFNETTVLSPAMMSGETTVLSAEPSLPAPTLTRVKTGEKININKPVFRIGKEKSYVDYFIADNTAISRSHANIHTENGEFFIEDTNSTNHTYINGKLINSNVKTKLISGDKVRLANEEFIFSV